MQKKLLYVSIYIKFLLIFSTFTHAKEQTSKFKGLPTKYDLIKRATFDLKPNEELYTHFKKSLVNHVQKHKEVIKILEDIDTYERRYKMIQQFTIDTIDIIERKTTMLENTISNFTMEINSNDDIIEALFFILEQTAFFGNVVLNSPEITRKILKSQNIWKEIIIWSFNFANKMQYL
ncbi:uncharacterized protein LOC122630326, partial [Vespula pensylvanica]|uniref:uncharacterized protein LOC122630326 n=1 Tax=Vespula pensylvanica TaxID=30213 RepID=UPI001CB9F5CA